MHDPLTVAFEIKSPFKTQSLSLSRNTKGAKKQRPVLITIWHKDPCTDGTDDSCGWFIRERHVNKEVLEAIRSDFEYHFQNNYWFDLTGVQKFSTIGILVHMYSTAAWIHFKRNRKKQEKFMRKYLYDIILFAENPVDCAGDNIVNRFNVLRSDVRFNGFAGMVYTDILRKTRKWYQHPRWHIRHWKIQIVFIQRLRNKLTRKHPINNNVDANLRATV